MWPFGKKTTDYDALGLALFQESAKYQTPTVDGTYAFLEKSGQLQYRDELTEKRILNAAAAVAVGEVVLFQALLAAGGRGAPAKGELLDHFYGYVQKLASMSFAEHRLRVDDGRPLMMRYVPSAIADHRKHPSDPTEERLAYEVARIVIRLHVTWAAGDADRVKMPTAIKDTNELSTAGDGLARAQRWIETSMGKQLKAALA